MDAEMLKYLAPMGVGGVLAAFMFHFYRRDTQASEMRWRGQSEQLLQVVKENTSAITALKGVIERER